MDGVPVEFQIEPLEDHGYLAAIRGGAQRAEVEFRATPDVMEALGIHDAAEQCAVRETAAFLCDHQPVIDLPPLIDLEDVAAAYDDYIEELRRRLRR
ncbi:hypothetical protein [Actinacidiphila oryziradicis]|uniref:Uncharacterized protein n=1 Tax=Actinacidiphila oryziradicis TaxID=2571141 RepID=A0A4U0S2Q4_9ACTN|nr:hypothetical protein [Actinacidiphila oryziradicis]TKA03160.1 hypothetical protein FCI23_37010 [Actinacidiphila oryziradicis]